MNATGMSSELGFRRETPQSQLLDTESDFYRSYAWCLNAFPTVQDVIEYLRQEINRLDEAQENWRRTEVMTNVFLLSCSITDAVDDYCLGDSYDFSKAVAVLPLVGYATRQVEKLLTISRKIRAKRLHRLRAWRENWEVGVEDFLKSFLAGERQDLQAPLSSGARLESLLKSELPADLQLRRLKIPAAFRSQDLTHFDIVALGRKFVAVYPERQQPILIAGLRTAGSYFAPLLGAYLKTEGYQRVSYMTMRPKKGLGSWEEARLLRCASGKSLAVLMDEPVDTGSTFSKGVDLLRKAGFVESNMVALIPIHPSRRDWKSGSEFMSLSRINVLSLEPEEWHKQRLFEVKAVESQVREYFQERQFKSVSVMASPIAEQLNSQLQSLSEEKFHTRLKRIYEVRLQNHAGRVETRYILAKSVGWGWLSYHAFIASDKLAQFVPPVLGLRNGILYTEWIPQDRSAQPAGQYREQLVNSLASYVASRVSSLGLRNDPSPDLGRGNQHKGLDLLSNTLSKAYGWKVAAVLKRNRIRHELSRQACPVPTLIDGKMRRVEWIIESALALKTDFEHHGLGKTELNITDPAYDLAEAILHFGLSPAEEGNLISYYIERCKDAGVQERLFLNKLLAGARAMKDVSDGFNDPRLSHRYQEFNQQYIEAWYFLTLHTMRFCAGFCRQPEVRRWRAPLVVMDIDGVLDKQIFGFPSTTAAGIQAVSLLHAHDLAVIVDTARSMMEVKEYCQAYGFVGGVADYGGAVWDAVNGRERVLVSLESLDQLETMRSALRQIPGVFLNDVYQYSIRAYTYERATTVPAPTLLIQNLMARLKVDRLSFHQTYTDTTILAKEIDKGRGMLELLEMVGQDNLDTVAIGDSEPDLAMFRVAKRSFAPSNISCRPVAKLLGCKIADRQFQNGLLSIVHSLIHPDGGQCDRCRAYARAWPKGQNLFLDILEKADQGRPGLLLRALLDPRALQAFIN